MIPLTIRRKVFKDVSTRREEQDKKWGYPQIHTFEEWMCILTEEIGEAAKCILEEDPEGLRNELVDIAAVAVAFITHIDTADILISEEAQK